MKPKIIEPVIGYSNERALKPFCGTIPIGLSPHPLVPMHTIGPNEHLPIPIAILDLRDIPGLIVQAARQMRKEDPRRRPIHNYFNSAGAALRGIGINQ